jgi:lysophospholipid acyltransferase (LPLAT)-like uncharacterized protein
VFPDSPPRFLNPETFLYQLQNSQSLKSLQVVLPSHYLNTSRLLLKPKPKIIDAWHGRITLTLTALVPESAQTVLFAKDHNEI